MTEWPDVGDEPWPSALSQVPGCLSTLVMVQAFFSPWPPGFVGAPQGSQGAIHSHHLRETVPQGKGELLPFLLPRPRHIPSPVILEEIEK